MTEIAQTGRTDTALPRSDRWRRAFFRFRQSRLSMIGAAMVAVVLFFALFGGLLAPYPDQVAGAVDTAARFQPPSAAHPFGTNELGQDVLSLVMAGTTVSVLAGFGVVLIGSVIGTLVGAIAGFVGGWTDEALMRLTDLTLTIPSLILAMAIAAALGPGFGNMVLAISLSWWPGYARLVRGEVMAKKEEMFVTAARAIGAGPGRILFRHILPNILPEVMVMTSLWMATAVRTEASLAFIGLGIAPPTPTWGGMMRDGFENILDAPWLSIWPGIAILVLVLGLNMIGDGLRDATDPKLRGE